MNQLERAREIIQIFLKYEGNLEAGRAELWFTDVPQDAVSAEDTKRLAELNCRWRDDIDCWSSRF